MATLTHDLDPRILGSRYGARILTINRNGKWVKIEDFHVGLDVKLAGGSPLPAMADGVVLEVSRSSVRGYMIAVDHGDRTAHRWHQVSASGRLAVGTRVRAGQTIARVGHAHEMGTGGKGEHGHLEYRIDRLTGETAPRVNTPNPEDFMASLNQAQRDQLLQDIRQTQLEDSERMRQFVFKQITDMQLRIASMHANGFKPWPNTPGAPGGSLTWFDDKIAAAVGGSARLVIEQVTATIAAGEQVDEDRIRQLVGAGLIDALSAVHTTTTIELKALPGSPQDEGAQLMLEQNIAARQLPAGTED